MLVIPSRFRATHRVQALRRRRRRRRYDIQPLARPVRRHLPSAARRVRRRSHRLQQLVLNRHPQRQSQPAVAIVRKEPVVPRLHRQARRHQQRLMPRTGDLEEDLLLTLQHDLAVVRPPREIHQPVELNELRRRQTRGHHPLGPFPQPLRHLACRLLLRQPLALLSGSPASVLCSLG